MREQGMQLPARKLHAIEESGLRGLAAWIPSLEFRGHLANGIQSRCSMSTTARPPFVSPRCLKRSKTVLWGTVCIQNWQYSGEYQEYLVVPCKFKFAYVCKKKITCILSIMWLMNGDQDTREVPRVSAFLVWKESRGKSCLDLTTWPRAWLTATGATFQETAKRWAQVLPAEWCGARSLPEVWQKVDRTRAWSLAMWPSLPETQFFHL